MSMLQPFRSIALLRRILCSNDWAIRREAACEEPVKEVGKMHREGASVQGFGRESLGDTFAQACAMGGLRTWMLNWRWY